MARSSRALFFFAILTCATTGFAALGPPTFVFQGALTTDNQIELVGITVNATEQITIRTYGYAGGTVNSTAATAGGFAPNAILFDSAGNEIASDSGGHCAITANDSVTGNCDDSYLQETLGPGTYTVALAEYDNVPAGSLFSSGFTQSANPGFTCAEFGMSGNFCDVTTALGAQRTGNYTLAVSADAAVAITNVDGTIAYLVGDVAPYTSDTAPSFGDGALNIQDLIQELFAVDNVPGYKPASCSDRFYAMDAFPADTGSGPGGDGVLDIRDLILELFRVDNLDLARPLRTTRMGVCAFGTSSISASPMDAVRSPGPTSSRPGAVQGELSLGSPQSVSATEERVPVYLSAEQDLMRIAVTLALGDGHSPLRFAPAAAPPSLLQDSRPGVVAAAWLSGITLRAGERLLLGYVTGPSGIGANLQTYGVSASGVDDNRKVELRVP